MAKTTPQFQMPVSPAVRPAEAVMAHVEGVPQAAPEAPEAVAANEPEASNKRPKAAPRERVIVSIPPDVLAEAEALADGEGMKRSMFIVHCMVLAMPIIRQRQNAAEAAKGGNGA